ncbi:MAG: glycosyltransferase family 4 protein [Deltaproteobacteria bacterium]|nr:glycosyltransferase family 4 protein [Deltaproteobacteria bacterium]
MRVWLIKVGEPLPTDGADERLFRMGMLAGLLVRSGHEVDWWTSTFDHVRRLQRSGEDAVTVMSDRYRIRMLHATGYRSNVSVARYLNHRHTAKKFRKNALSEPKPDIILCSLPVPELCVEATRYGREHGVPVVLDVRDLWPDLYVEVAPAWCRGIARRILEPLFGMVRKACSEATAIVGVTPEFVAWGLGNAGRAAKEWDREFPMGYQRAELPRQEREGALSRWRDRGITDNAFACCFFGAMGRQFDLDTVIDAARMLQGSGRLFQFVLCGKGDRLDEYRGKARSCPNVLFPGWVNRADIWALMGRSQVGLAPYLNKPNFTLNLPNKPVEYMSAGLPIVSSLSGVLARYISESRCGVAYEEGNPESLVEALIRLYDNREELRSMAESSRGLYERSFVAEKVYGEMIGHLCRIAGEKIPAQA